MNVPRHNSALARFKEHLKEAERFHMETGKVHQTLESLTADLDRTGIDYVIIGALALNAHGYRRETVDVDVLVRPEGLDVFMKECVGKGYLPRLSGARKTFRNTRTGVQVEFITSGEYPGDGEPKPVVFPDPVEVSQGIQGVKVMNLPALVELKLASGMTNPGRLRDLADVQELIRVLRLPPDYAEQLNPYVRDRFAELQSAVEADTRSDDA